MRGFLCAKDSNRRVESFADVYMLLTREMRRKTMNDSCCIVILQSSR